MANATKKSMILTVAAVLIAVLLFAASMAIGTETQPNAFADFWDDYATEESGITGLGTVESPFVIASAEDLARMSVWVNSGVHADSHYLLSQNIDLSGHDFTPIGNIGYPFAGSFDGDGYTVSGLTINALGSPAGAHFIGLFGVTDATASIRSFGILSGNITFDTNEDISSLYVGSVAAVNNGTIEDVYSYADLQISLEYIYSQEAFVGGLTAQNNDGATVTGSLFAGQLDVAQPVDALGGICGEN
ncbi:MAG: hypothetical protein PHI19_03580, partial [Clostridia bacterium]|nr:hypothetical protein [Clostridia bacterium]